MTAEGSFSSLRWLVRSGFRRLRCKTALGLLVASSCWVGESLAAGPKIFERGPLTVYGQNDNWCRFTVHVIVRAPDISVFQGDKPEIHKLAADLRAELARTCPKARTLWIKGLVDEKRVYDGAVGDMLRDPVLRDRYVARTEPQPRRTAIPRRMDTSPAPARAPSGGGGSIEGEWEGQAKCGRDSYTVKLYIQRAASGDFAVRLENFRTGPVPKRVSKSEFLARFDAAQNAYQFVPRRAGTPFTGRPVPDMSAMTIAAKECAAFDAQRVTADMASRAPTTARPVGGGSYKPGDSLEKRCDALLAWAMRMTREYPVLNMMRTPDYQLREKAGPLYADDDFVPVFGVPYDQLDPAYAKEIRSDIIFNCSKDPFIRAKSDWMWGHLIFYPVGGGEQWQASAVQTIQTIRRLRHELKEKTERSYPPVADSYGKIEQEESSAKRDYAALWPSEVAAFEKALARRKQDLAKQIVSAWQMEMLGLTEAGEVLVKVPEGLQRNAKFIAAMNDSDREVLHRDLADKLAAALTPAPPGDAQAQAVALSAAATLDRLIGSQPGNGRGQIAAVLDALVSARISEAEKFAGTLDGLVSFATWRKVFEKEIEPFGRYDTVKNARSALGERAISLGSSAVENIRTALATPAASDDFLPVRDRLLRLDNAAGGSAISKPLWEEYESAVDRWMQSQVAGVASVSRGSTRSEPVNDPLAGFSNLPGSSGQAGSAFASADLSEPRILSAIHRKDFGAIHKADADYVYLYLASLTGSVSQLCPGTVPFEAKQAGMEARLGKEIFQPGQAGSDAVQELGGRVILDMMQRMANPGKLFSDTVKAEEIRQKAEGDAVRLVQQVSCDAQAWRPFFDNLTAYFRDPTDGVDPALLSMAELCVRGLSTSGGGSKAFCSCAGPVLDGALTDMQKKFVRARAKENLPVARELLPRVNAKLGACRG